MRRQRRHHDDDRAGAPDDGRAVAARHRRQPDGRLSHRAGVPRRDARAPLRADRRDLQRRRARRAARAGRLRGLEGRAAGDGPHAGQRERRTRDHGQRDPAGPGGHRAGAGDARGGARAGAALGAHRQAGGARGDRRCRWPSWPGPRPRRSAGRRSPWTAPPRCPSCRSAASAASGADGQAAQRGAARRGAPWRGAAGGARARQRGRRRAHLAPPAPLAERWTLVLPNRPGFAASPPLERGDFEAGGAADRRAARRRRASRRALLRRGDRAVRGGAAPRRPCAR